MSVCAAACAAALTLTACLPGEGGSGSSSSSSSSETTTPDEGTTSPSSSEPEESFDAPEQQEVDATTAKKALPAAQDVPDKSWSLTNWGIDESAINYDPDECAAVDFKTDSAEAYRAKHRTTHEYSHFSQKGPGGNMLHVSLESFDTPYPLAYFDEAGESIGGCSTYTMSGGGASATYGASPVPAPPLGERSLGVRITASGGGDNIDLLYVRSGHNLVTVIRYTDDDSYDERLLKKYATSVITDLKKAS